MGNGLSLVPDGTKVPQTGDVGEETEKKDAQGAPQTPPLEDALLTQIKTDPAGIMAYIKELRAENAARRKDSDAVKAMKTEAERAAEAQRQAAEQALAEQGKFKDLAEKRASELAALKAEASTLKPYKEALEALLKKRLEALTEEQRTRIVPQFDDPIKTLAWLDANADLFASRQAPSLNPGDTTPAPTRSDQIKTNLSKIDKPLVRL